ncbi:MAG: threonylcarbamoyl-AMP synthase [Candidatus Levybacteria bacterium]|nr:threonylcarbamoyl-AMP synthase [Candidatus Levybacteria bacterium]
MNNLSEVEKAINILNQGGIVIFPTDTAFGVGCRIDNEKAVERLFKIRKRPGTQATPVLVDTVKMAKDYLQPIPKEVIDKLIEPFWPGALTIILLCKADKVPALVRGGGSTLGVRIPNHPIARDVIRSVGVPILGPSANFHGEKTPYAFEDLNPEFTKLADYVLFGECTIKMPSTVVDCSISPWKIIRRGALFVSF